MIWVIGIVLIFIIISAINFLWVTPDLNGGDFTLAPVDKPSHHAQVWAEMQKIKDEIDKLETTSKKVVDKPERIKYAKKVNPIEGRKFREINGDTYYTKIRS